MLIMTLFHPSILDGLKAENGVQAYFKGLNQKKFCLWRQPSSPCHPLYSLPPSLPRRYAALGYLPTVGGRKFILRRMNLIFGNSSGDYFFLRVGGIDLAFGLSVYKRWNRALSSF
ncbi:hypothetical protein AYI69_g2997 [Smittium culicis]|uniref:Uncharacterized protein n=1 Tax=Smittium culicis TaxID=133412 RepID=A0A1R1YL90_9FUNG|nr:hypothetical protein AYI69_g2997 [Smittium culicis]